MNNITEHLKDGPVTHAHSEHMVCIAEKWMLMYFGEFGAKRPGDFEDDLCGKPSMEEMASGLMNRFRESPFYPALARLFDKNMVKYWKDDHDDYWYDLVLKLQWTSEGICHLDEETHQEYKFQKSVLPIEDFR